MILRFDVVLYVERYRVLDIRFDVVLYVERYRVLDSWNVQPEFLNSSMIRVPFFNCEIIPVPGGIPTDLARTGRITISSGSGYGQM